jgi:hypothetical protein
MSNQNNNQDDILQAFRLVVGDPERGKLSEWLARYPELHPELVQIAIEWYRLQAKMDSGSFPPENRQPAERLLKAAMEPIQSSPEEPEKTPGHWPHDLIHSEKTWQSLARLEPRLNVAKEGKWRSP